MEFTFTSRGPVTATTIYEVVHVQRIEEDTELFDVLEAYQTSMEALARAKIVLRDRILSETIDRKKENIIVVERVTVQRRIG